MKLEFSVIRSPAKASWWLMCNGAMVDTFDTKAQAMLVLEQLASKYA